MKLYTSAKFHAFNQKSHNPYTYPPHYLTNEEIGEKIEEFEELYGIPQIVGTIDGCHIEINAPPQNHEDYFNRKQHYSVNLQAIVDAKLKFIHATVGYPGSIHDARVLRLSGLYDFAENEQILSGPMGNINGTEIGPHLAFRMLNSRWRFILKKIEQKTTT